MKIKKPVKIILITLVSTFVSIVVIGFSILALPWAILSLGQFLEPNPPKPEQDYGEFPFKLVYEQNGEINTIENTLVIEYLGIGYNEGVGKHYLWDVYYKNAEADIESYQRIVSIELFEGYNEVYGDSAVFFELGDCEYFMGLDDGTNHLYPPGEICISSFNYSGPLSEQELYEAFGITIIEKSIAPPLS